jgi:hypothetical protein
MSPQYESATVVELGAADTLVHGSIGPVVENPDTQTYRHADEGATAIDLGFADDRVRGPFGNQPDNADAGGEWQLMDHDR